ncbi:hypothetical protein ACHHYP_01320 [Achlya hypogyna]|uniref:Actin-like protein n=1 Tax=Achlya hypogyna TaxID=1202772 RepID=A0A1V9Z998_ACHHY|nr:hypothetical protein ACHHYP_01320 [Achlya hypogyna]
MSSAVPSYLRSTSSSSGKVKKDTKVDKKKVPDIPIRRVAPVAGGTKKEEFRVRPPPAPLAIAIPAASPPKTASTLTHSKTAKRLVPSPKKIKRAATISEDRKLRSPPDTANIPSYMRQTVSRGYKEGTLQHPAEPLTSSSPPKKVVTPKQALLKTQTSFKATTAPGVTIRRTSRQIEPTNEQPKVSVPDLTDVKETSVAHAEPATEAIVDNQPECKTPPPPTDSDDIVPAASSPVTPIPVPRPSPRAAIALSVDDALDLAAAMRTISSLTDEAQKKAIALAKAETARLEVVADRDALRSSMDKMTAAHTTAKAKCESLADAVRTLERQRESLEAELLEHKVALSDVKAHVAAATAAKNATVATAEGRVVELTAHVATLELEKSARDKELEHLNRICGALQLQVNAFETKQAEWTAQAAGVAELHDTLTTLQRRAEVSEDLQRQMTDLEADRAALRARVAALTASEAETAATIRQLEVQVLAAGTQGSSRSLEATVAGLQRQLDQATLALEDNDVTRGERHHELEISRLHSEVASLKAQLDEATTTAAATRAEMASVDTRMQALQRQYEETTAEVARTASVHAQLTKDLQQRDDRIAELVAERQTADAEAAVARATLLCEHEAEWAARLTETKLDAERRAEAVEASYELQLRDLADQVAAATMTAESTAAAKAESTRALAALQAQIAEKDTTLQSLATERSDCASALEATVAEHETTIVALTTRLSELQAAAARDAEHQNALRADAATHAAVVESFSAQVATIEADLRDERARSEEVKARYGESMTVLSALEAERGELLARVEALTADQAQIAAAHASEVAHLRGSVDELAGVAQDYAIQSAMLSAKEAELATTATAHAAVVESFVVQLEALQAKVAAKDAEAVTLSAAHKAMGDEMDTLRQRMLELKAQGEATPDRTAELEAGTRDLTAQLAQAKATAAELANARTALNAQQQQQEACDVQLRVLTESHKELKEIDAAKSRQISALQDKLQCHAMQERELRATIAGLQAQLAATAPAPVAPFATPAPVIGKGVLVVHLGAFELQAGLLMGDQASFVPAVKLPALVAVPQGGAAELHRVLQGSSYVGTGSVRVGYERGYFVGKDAVHFLYEHPDPALRCILRQERVVQAGHITSVDYLEALLHQLFAAIGMEDAVCNYNVIVTHKPQLPKHERERLVEVLFEKCGAKGALLATDALMSLRARGKSTGLVVDVGADASYVVPIYEDMILDHAVVVVPMGGEALVQFMVSMLLSQDSDEYHKIPSRLQTKIGRALLESKGMVAKDFDAMAEKHGRFERTSVQVLPTQSQPVWHKAVAVKTAHPLHVSYCTQLPAGPTLELHCDVERFVAPELLWQPKLNPDNACDVGLQDAIGMALSACAEQLHEELLANVVCTGGVCLLPGFKARLTQEIQKLYPLEPSVHVDVATKDEHPTFAGTCMYADGLQDRLWIDGSEYDAMGPGALHAKCF